MATQQETAEPKINQVTKRMREAGIAALHAYRHLPSGDRVIEVYEAMDRERAARENGR